MIDREYIIENVLNARLETNLSANLNQIIDQISAARRWNLYYENITNPINARCLMTKADNEKIFSDNMKEEDSTKEEDNIQEWLDLMEV